MALDWDYEQERLYGFESFKDKDQRDKRIQADIDLIASLPDNGKVLLYCGACNKIYNLARKKANGQFERVYETWTEMRLENKESL